MTLNEEIEKCRREIDDLLRRRDAIGEGFVDSQDPRSGFNAKMEHFRKAADEGSRGGDARTGERLLAAWGRARERLTAQLCLLEARHFMSSALHLARSGDPVGARNQLANAVWDFAEAREILSSQDEGVNRVREELEETARGVRQETEQMIARLEHALAETEHLIEEFDRAA